MRIPSLELVLVTACVVGCSSSSSSLPPLTDEAFVGSWTGTSSTGKLFRYTFTSDAAFSWELVHDTGSDMLGSGTFSTDGVNLVLDGTFTGEGGTVRGQLSAAAYADSSAMCDTPLIADAPDGVVGTWTSTVTSQLLDDAGAPMGQAFTSERSLDLGPDGTFFESNGGVMQSGTYTTTGDQVTTTIHAGNTEAVESFSLVGGSALCDPAYSR